VLQRCVVAVVRVVVVVVVVIVIVSLIVLILDDDDNDDRRGCGLWFTTISTEPALYRTAAKQKSEPSPGRGGKSVQPPLRRKQQ
jgi:hypothetical protein